MPHSALFTHGIKPENEWELTRLKEGEERAKASGREQAFGKWWYGDLAEERVTHCFSVLYLETDKARQNKILSNGCQIKCPPIVFPVSCTLCETVDLFA